MEFKYYITVKFNTEDYEQAETDFNRAIEDFHNALLSRSDLEYEVLDEEIK